jgi:hypothetical protein
MSPGPSWGTFLPWSRACNGRIAVGILCSVRVTAREDARHGFSGTYRVPAVQAHDHFPRVAPGVHAGHGRSDVGTGKARSSEHLLALVVLLKSFQKLGYFPDLDEVPQLVVEHVRGLLELGEDVEPPARFDAYGRATAGFRP